MRLELVFVSPLRITLAPPEPTTGYRAIFTTQTDGLTFKGENVSETLGVGHFATVAVEWVDATGAPAKVDGPTSWESTDPAVLTCQVSTGNPLIANCQAVAIGTAQIQATADADMGDGIKHVTSTIEVTVIAGEAVGGSMTFTDMGTGPANPSTGRRS